MVQQRHFNYPPAPAGITSANISATNQVAGAYAGEQVYYLNNGTGGAITFKFPPTPVLNQIISVVDYSNNSGTYNQTLSGNGNSFSYGGSTATTYVFAQNGAAARFSWNGTIWTQLG